MSQNNSPNLAGWAAIIAAIAALITAIGFPNFFPDLVKQYLLKNRDNSSTNSSKTQEGDLQPIPKSSTSSQPLPLKKYSELRRLLADRKFKEADEKTNKILLQLTGNDSYNNSSDAELIDCVVYQTIDSLWREYSNNKFGFSVQIRIFQKVGNTEKFGDLVDWRENGKWLNYTDLNKTLEEAPQGYFPSRYRGSKSSSSSLSGAWMVWSFLPLPNRTTAHCINSPSS
ncbi:MAG: GUN4 domain-containing protein [Pleurocapsa sp. MO_226.B13]|nr:GUN4 domain-containing protein [Pleurocapsa sp. MO_226.B13]